MNLEYFSLVNKLKRKLCLIINTLNKIFLIPNSIFWFKKVKTDHNGSKIECEFMKAGTQHSLIIGALKLFLICLVTNKSFLFQTVQLIFAGNSKCADGFFSACSTNWKFFEQAIKVVNLRPEILWIAREKLISNEI